MIWKTTNIITTPLLLGSAVNLEMAPNGSKLTKGAAKQISITTKNKQTTKLVFSRYIFSSAPFQCLTSEDVKLHIEDLFFIVLLILLRRS